MDPVQWLLKALESACVTREGEVQVKFMGRWMLAKDVEKAVVNSLMS